jgi:hypothetical protein
MNDVLRAAAAGKSVASEVRRVFTDDAKDHARPGRRVLLVKLLAFVFASGGRTAVHRRR